LCCGPGRHAVALAKRGFDVTGVDVSSFLLEKARKRATEGNVSVEFVLEDMRDFNRADSFDLILNIYTSFGYFKDKRDDLKVLKLVHQNLKESGVFLLEMISKEWIAKNYQSTQSTRLANGDLL